MFDVFSRSRRDFTGDDEMYGLTEIVQCPQCVRKLRVPDDLLGKKVKCPTCGTTFIGTV